MSLRLFLHILMLRKWYILTALFMAPVLTVVFLLFAEPVFVSKCKLQVVDRQDERDPTRAAKPTLKDDTYIQAQIELIFTDTVMAKVVDKAGLLPPPPNQSFFARHFKSDPPGSEFSPERLRVETIRNLKRVVTVDALSPVIMTISTRMNTPELAQRTTKAVFDAYIEEFSRIQKESGELRNIYDERLKSVQANISEATKELEEFHKNNVSTGLIRPTPPTITTDVPPGTRSKEPLADPGKLTFLPGAKDFNPLQRVSQEKAQLELELIRIQGQFSEDNFQVKRLKEQIAQADKLLEGYRKDLTQQNQLALRERELTWRLETWHASYSSILSDRDRIEGTMIVKESSKGSISVLDPPTFDPLSVFPKRTMTVIAATFAGLVLGLAMAYIAHVIDATYHLPEDLQADTGLPVLAAIPIQ